MPNLSRADAVLARVLDHLNELRVHSSGDANTLQVLRAEVNGVRGELAQARARLVALQEETRAVRESPEGIAAIAKSRFGAMFEHALDAILLADDGGRYLDANPSACNLLGYTRQEMLNLSITDITPEPYRHLVPQAWSEFLALGSMSGEYSVRHRQGTQIPVEFRAVANIQPGEHLSILRDVSRLRQAQHDLQHFQHDNRARALTSLYAVLDSLVATKIDLNAESRWKTALIGTRRREIASEINQVMANVRTAIAALESNAAITADGLSSAPRS